jgi:alkylation response protein AidB-like acyl-CoA dehydrogenase
MDFAITYTKEQEQFRQEIRDWITENVPEDMKEPIDGREFTEEQYRFWREKHKDLAARGWLYPTQPKEYGGGGLSGDHETIILEEFHRARVVRSFSGALVIPPLMVWGTEEQKQKFLVPFLKADKATWQRLTEPQSGADLANVQAKAVRDGDDWLLSGQNVFISGRPRPEWTPGGPDFLHGMAVTDTDAPRHRNLGFFLVPVPSPGLEIKEMNLLPGHDQHVVFMDNVRVPGDHLIGGDHQGWQVFQTLGEVEHGGGGSTFPRDEAVDNLIAYTKETKQNGSSVGSDPVAQQVTMNAYIDAHVDGLFARHTYWMYENRMDIVFEGNVANVHNRDYECRNAIRVRDVMGMYSLLDGQDPGAPHRGAQEVYQRDKAGQRHAGGSTNIARVILARRIGISRTQERPAPTPSSTAASSSS